MELQPPPVYVLCPGRVYRRDAIDATHLPLLHAGRGARGRRGADAGRPQGHARALRALALRRRPPHPHALALLPLHGAERRDRRLVLPVRRERAAASASTSAGSSSAAPAWSTRTSSASSRATTPSAVSGFAFGWGIERIAQLKHGLDRPALALRGRPALPRAVPGGAAMKVPMSWLRSHLAELPIRTRAPRRAARGHGRRGRAHRAARPAARGRQRRARRRRPRGRGRPASERRPAAADAAWTPATASRARSCAAPGTSAAGDTVAVALARPAHARRPARSSRRSCAASSRTG